MQAAALEGERVLILEDEPIIALDTQEICERAGASVVLAPTVPQALRFAEDPAVSAGILDIRVGREDAEPVCKALGRRRVPFIFFTGMRQWPRNRWPAIPVVQKPAVPAAIIGALKFVLLADTHDVVLDSSDQEDETLARIDQLIAEGEQRILRIRHAVAKLDAKEFDTSAGKDVLATMTKIVENMRVHRRMIVSSAWRSPFR